MSEAKVVRDLMEAAFCDDCAWLQKLIEERRQVVEIKDMYLRTSLHVACSNGSLEAIKVLMAAGADIKVTDEAGCTPLHEAARNGHLACIRWMLAHGACHTVYSIKGYLPLDMAKKNCHTKVVHYLKEQDQTKNSWDPSF